MASPAYRPPSQRVFTNQDRRAILPAMSAHPLETRRAALNALKTGKDSMQEVSSRLGVGLSTLERWAKADREGRTPTTEVRTGRPPVLTSEGLEELARIVAGRPGSSLDEFAQELEKVVGFKPKSATLRDALKKLGFKHTRPTFAVKEDGAPAATPKRYGYSSRHRQDASQRYPSSATDAEWALIEDLFAKLGPGRPPRHSRREMFDAIGYTVRGGLPWRMLPKEFPKWQNVYATFRRWAEDGLFEKMHDRLRTLWRERIGRHEHPTAAVIDSQSVKTAEKGGSLATTGRRK